MRRAPYNREKKRGEKSHQAYAYNSYSLTHVHACVFECAYKHTHVFKKQKKSPYTEVRIPLFSQPFLPAFFTCHTHTHTHTHQGIHNTQPHNHTHARTHTYVCVCLYVYMHIHIMHARMSNCSIFSVYAPKHIHIHPFSVHTSPPSPLPTAARTMTSSIYVCVCVWGGGGLRV